MRTWLTERQDKHFEITPKTNFQEFEKVIKDDPRTANIDREPLQLIFERVSTLKMTIFTQTNSQAASREESQALR